MKLTGYLLILVCGIIFTGCQDKEKAAKVLTEGKTKDYVEKSIKIDKAEYRFKIKKFDKPQPVKFINKGEAAYNTPEQTLTTHLSAMRALDFDWFCKSFDSDSLQQLKQADKKDNITPAIRQEQWQKITMLSAEFTHKVEYTSNGKVYTIIAYCFISADGKQQKTHAVPMINNAGRWFITRALGDDAGYGKLDDLLMEKPETAGK